MTTRSPTAIRSPLAIACAAPAVTTPGSVQPGTGRARSWAPVARIKPLAVTDSRRRPVPSTSPHTMLTRTLSSRRSIVQTWAPTSTASAGSAAAADWNLGSAAIGGAVAARRLRAGWRAGAARTAHRTRRKPPAPGPSRPRGALMWPPPARRTRPDDQYVDVGHVNAPDWVKVARYVAAQRVHRHGRAFGRRGRRRRRPR